MRGKFRLHKVSGKYTKIIEEQNQQNTINNLPRKMVLCFFLVIFFVIFLLLGTFIRYESNPTEIKKRQYQEEQMKKEVENVLRDQGYFVPDNNGEK